MKARLKAPVKLALGKRATVEDLRGIDAVAEIEPRQERHRLPGVTCKAARQGARRRLPPSRYHRTYPQPRNEWRMAPALYSASVRTGDELTPLA